MSKVSIRLKLCTCRCLSCRRKPLPKQIEANTNNANVFPPFLPHPSPSSPPESNANKTESKEARSLCVFQRLLAKSQLNLCQHHGFYLFVVLFCFRFAPPSPSLSLLFLSLALCRFFCAVFKCKLIKTIEGKQKLGGAKK